MCIYMCVVLISAVTQSQMQHCTVPTEIQNGYVESVQVQGSQYYNGLDDKGQYYTEDTWILIVCYEGFYQLSKKSSFKCDLEKSAWRGLTDDVCRVPKTYRGDELHTIYCMLHTVDLNPFYLNRCLYELRADTNCLGIQFCRD